MSEKTLFKKEDGLSKRLWLFQCEDISIEKSKQGYGYKYAPLDVIIPSIREILKKCGLCFIHQTFNLEGKTILTTKIFSSDNFNDYIESSSELDKSISFKGMNSIQAEGALLTYYRRYHLSMMLGLTSEGDTDASSNPKAKKDDSESKGKQTTNYVEVFTNLLKTNQTKEAITKAFNMYKNKMSEEDQNQINAIIVNKFNSNSKNEKS